MRELSRPPRATAARSWWRSPAASRRPKARRSSAARRRSIWWSGRRAISACPQLLARAERGGAVVDTEFPLEDKFDSLPAPDRAGHPGARRLGFRHRAGGLRQVLHLLRRALYARRRAVAAGRRRSSPRSSGWREAGVREVTLIGQNVNAYHGDRARRRARGRSAACCTASREVPGIARLRYTTSHPGDMEDEPDRRASRSRQPDAAPASAGAVGLRPHPRRHEPPAHARRLSARRSTRLRAARPDMALSSDFIVGFPGETEDGFPRQPCADRARSASPAPISFKYSPRPGTPGRRHGGSGAGRREARAAAAPAARDRAPADAPSTRAASDAPSTVLFERTGPLSWPDRRPIAISADRCRSDGAAHR